MLGWIRIYDRPRPGPSGPPERSPTTENRKTIVKYSDSSFENKPIRTALQFLREQEIVHPNRPSIRQFDLFWCRQLMIGVTVHLTILNSLQRLPVRGLNFFQLFEVHIQRSHG